MMPVIDGYQFCKSLKEDEQTDHIPIVLLTARAHQKDKISGLDSGADAYMIKPFEKEELLIRINNLLASRKLLHQKYKDPKSFQELPVPQNEFLIKTNAIIDRYLEDSDFNVHLLAYGHWMSRRTVHKKLKSLIGLSTSLYIRNYRLQKAHQLLQSNNLTVSEVAYQTGFSNLSWFTQAYKEQFDHTPSSTRK